MLNRDITDNKLSQESEHAALSTVRRSGKRKHIKMQTSLFNFNEQSLVKGSKSYQKRRDKKKLPEMKNAGN